MNFTSYLALFATLAPVVITGECADSTLRFKIINVDGEEITRSCEWVARKNTVARCALAGVSDACPLTCGSCDTTPIVPTPAPAPVIGTSCVDSTVRFTTVKDDGEEITKSCEWVARIDTTTRCTLTGVSDACPLTCGLCTTTRPDQNICPSMCLDGNNCHNELCQDCFFSCHERSCPDRQGTCARWCTDQNYCSNNSCSKCIFCKEVSQSACPLVTFEDVTATTFSADNDYWGAWLHSGRPYIHTGSPVFVDINGDKILDYFNPLHGFPFPYPFEKRMELGMGGINEGEYTLKEYSDRIICSDSINCDDQWVDAHGTVVIDLDGDGYLDIFISNGGGQGSTFKEEYHTYFDNWLFWGETRQDSITGKEIIVFVGGRDAARNAGVEMMLARGRFNYLFDANGDGKLDIFSSNDRRASNHITPGVLLLNNGDRTWKEDRGMMEYSRTMMITDADGDGFAEEFLINRSYCYPQRLGPETDPSHPELGPYSDDVKMFCQRRPGGTNAIYKFNHTSNQMEEISNAYQNFWAGLRWSNPCCSHGGYGDGDNDCNAVSMISGDFDDDQRADQVLLYNSKMVFFFSSDRQKGELPDNKKHTSLEIKFPDYCIRGLTLQAFDIDNDGKEEILVSCINPGVFLLYTKAGVREWTLENGCNDNGSLGDLNNRFLSVPTEEVMDEFCDIYSESWNLGSKMCKNYKNTGKASTKFQGVAVVDINNDGFYDIVSISDFGYLRFFYNKPSQNASENRFICFKLIGTPDALDRATNYYGVGATVILHAKDGNGAIINQVREFSSVQHHTDYYSSKDDRIIFGLGSNLTPFRVTVNWFNGNTQLYRFDGWRFSKSLQPIEIMDLNGYMQLEKFRLKSHLGDSDDHDLCLAVNKHSEIVMETCELSNLNEQISLLWKIDRKGRIWSNMEEQHCLSTPDGIDIEENTPLVLLSSPCYRSSWFLNSEGQIRYGGSPFVLGFDGSGTDKRARLISISNASDETKWMFDVNVNVEISDE